jgi:hypothetical protein
MEYDLLVRVEPTCASGCRVDTLEGYSRVAERGGYLGSYGVCCSGRPSKSRDEYEGYETL